MEYRSLPRAGLEVSVLGLGTMTFGEQTSPEDALAQLDLAHEAGVNLIDTAEMYPVPPREGTQGESERLIGHWLKDRRCRDDVIVATKVTAPHRGLQHIRGGNLKLNSKNIAAALEGSLKRLATDRIDLYQIHWPERATTNFGRRDYPGLDQNDAPADESTSLEETLAALTDLQAAGKIRHLGLSNETPWGLMSSLSLAEKFGWPPVVSLQNPYNLLNRIFESGLAEIAHREQIPLLAYSPLAFGKLTGKYMGSQLPAQSRLARFPKFDRYNKGSAEQNIQAYAKLARTTGLTLTELSLAFLRQQSTVASVLVGASTADQLRQNLATLNVTLSADTLTRLNKIHARHPNPCP